MARSIINNYKVKLNTKSGLLIMEIFAIFIFLVDTFFICWYGLSFLPILLKVFLSSFIFSMQCSLLIRVKKFDNKKVYNILLDYFIVMFSENVIYKDDEKNGTKKIIPYKTTINKYIIEKENSSKVSNLIGSIRIVGFDIFSFKREEIAQKMSMLKDTFYNSKSKFSLIKTDDYYDFSKQTEFYNSKKVTTQSEKEIDQLEDYSRIINDENNLFSNLFEKKYYIICYGKNRKELELELEYFKKKFISIGFKVEEVMKGPLIKLFAKVTDPFQEHIESEFNDVKENIDDILANEKIEFKNSYIKTDKAFMNVSTINNLPEYGDVCWLLPLMDLDNTVLIDFLPVSYKSVEKSLDNSILNLRTNIESTRAKNTTRKTKIEYELERMSNLQQELSTQTDILKYTRIFVLTTSKSKSDLFEKINTNEKILRENDILMSRNYFYQEQAMKSIFPSSEEYMIEKGVYVPCEALAYSFPFLSSELRDNNGMFFGLTDMREPIFFNHFSRDNGRQNNNMLLLGSSGSAKTSTAKKIINYDYVSGAKIFIIDPEGEYGKLSNYYDGNVIKMGKNNSDSIINPLQVFTTIELQDNNEENKQDFKEINLIAISNHIQLLETWFKILFPDVDQKTVRILLQKASEMYIEFIDKNKKNIFDLKSEEFPTFDDLIFKIENDINKIKESNEKKELDELLFLLRNEFQNFGRYKTIYNGKSTIDLNHSFNVFDTLELTETKNEKLIQSQLLLITAFIQKEIIKNDNGNRDKIVLLIDEAHLLIDEKNQVGLDFIFQMAKRIRKRNGSIILMTQNPKDFLGSKEIIKKTSAILNNVQYSFVMKLSAEDVNYINEMYKTIGGLTRNEIDFISNAEAGQGLLFVNSISRIPTRVNISKKEQEALQIPNFEGSDEI